MAVESWSHSVAGLLPRNRGSFVFSHGAGAGVVGGVRESYMGNARAMYEWCVRRGEDALWLHASRSLSNAAGPTARFRSARGAVRAMRAAISMGDSNNGAPWPLLSDRTWVVQGWHGTPLKAIGRAWAGHPRRDLHVLERPDYFVSSGPEYTRRYLQCFDVDPSGAWETGNPRNDQLVNATAADKADRVRALRAVLPEESRSFDQVVLHAPTWREWGDGTPINLPDRDLAALDHELLRMGALLVLRPHHREARAALHAARDLSRIIVADNLDLPWEINDWCLVSDLLITDYSSVFYDYLVLDRPVIHLVPDLEEYGNRRGFLVDPRADFAGPAVTTQEALLGELRRRLRDPDLDAALRRGLNTRHNPHEDGHAAERVGERLLTLKQEPRRA